MPIQPTAQDFMVLGFLVFLEGVLSIDNALVLALIVRPLPPKLRRRALTYGIVGAIVFRLIAVSMAAWLIHWDWVKLIGGAYLIYLPLQYYLTSRREEFEEARTKESLERSFWMTVVVVELTDILFAVDSILTAVALSKKVWVVMCGGILGMLAMRIAAGVFVRLLDKFPRFEPTAYLLVFLVGIKLLIEGIGAELGVHLVDFEGTSSPGFWAFWCSMLAAFLSGFLPPGRRKHRRQH